MTHDPGSERAIVVSNDTHIGPRLVEDLRPYCPSAYLDEFDRFAATTAEARHATAELLGGSGYLEHPNLRTLGHHDSAARLADYDYDGIAAGVIFHGSMNMEPIPFVEASLQKFGSRQVEPELVGVGMRIYNRWLADFVSQAPHRHIGLAQVPSWDIEATLAEVEWAHDSGLRGVNFPAMREGAPEYNKRVWEPLWSVCEERRIPLVTHVGGVFNARYSGLESVALVQIESNYASRRAVWWLIFAGVFERHPDLKYVVTETPGNWFPPTAAELDSIHGFYQLKRSEPLNAKLLEQVPRRPSEYMLHNVFFGASFASPYEVDQAILHGLDTQLLWGSDYPHFEGTFVHRDIRDQPSVGRLALRNTFCDVATERTRRMIGENAIGVYNLDAAALRTIADDIGAPTFDELATPIDAVPADANIPAFRSGAGAWS
jgi:predicted TIM-barrel fold metal-dependent hydrolase